MLINKIDDSAYIIKLLNKKLNIYDKDELEEITRKIFEKINKNNKLESLLIIDLYDDKMYGTIITLKSYKSIIKIANEYEVKIHIHLNPTFLYKIDYLNIDRNNLSNKNIYYYENSFYLEIKDKISKKEYIKLLETSEILYENADEVINKGIKINI